MNHDPSQDLAFIVFEQPIIVRSFGKSAPWHARLNAIMGPYCADVVNPDAAEIIGVEQVQDAATPWHITYDKYTYMLADEEQMLQHLEWRLCTIGIYTSSALLGLHAGAVTSQGASLILPGNSGTGKTTLTLALMSQGWHVLTDDVALLTQGENADMQVQPCARCCHVDDDAYAQLTARGVHLHRPIGGLATYARPTALGQAAPVRWIVVPQFDGQPPMGITRLTQAEAVAVLLGNTLRQHRVSRREQWRAAITLACQAPAYRLVFPSLAEGLEGVAQITERRTSA
jgi:hypothetical protein